MTHLQKGETAHDFNPGGAPDLACKTRTSPSLRACCKRLTTTLSIFVFLSLSTLGFASGQEEGGSDVSTTDQLIQETEVYELADMAPAPWHEPPVIRPRPGRTITLNVDTNHRRGQRPVVRTPKGNVRVDLRSYYSPQAVGPSNGLVGPTLRVQMNDTIQINIQNTQQPNLSPCVPGQHQTPDCFDHTNFHTHGLHISPKLRSDNVLISIAPAGESSARCEEKPECTAAPHQGCCYKGEFEHRYELGKGVEGGRHYPGTFWYHAHKHGSTAVQLASGMAGALIIEDPVGSPIQGFQERVLLLQQLAFDDRGTVLPQGGPLRQLRRNWSRDGEAQRYTTINGVAKPGIPMCSGEVQRWRVIDGGVFEMVPIELAWVRGSSSRVATRTAQLIAIDGITLKQARDVFGRQGGGPLDMGPGYRLDLLVKDWPELRRLGFKLVLRKKAPTDQSMVFSGMDDAGPNQVLAEVIPDTSARCQQPYRTELLRQDMPLPAPLPDLDEVQGRRVVEFSVRREEPRFLINGRTFHHEVDREFCLPMGRKEEWTLSTARGSGVHPFHIHVNAFQMIRDGKPAEWRDTILIREGEDLTMRTFYENFDGRFVLHCHILNHEDEGMMQLVEISKSNPPRCIGPASTHQESTHSNKQEDENRDEHENEHENEHGDEQ